MDQTFRIKKILNNNVVSAISGFQEVIVVGLSIGFNAKKNDKIDVSKIEKVFELRKEDLYRTSQLVKEIPEDFFFEMYSLIESVSIETQIQIDPHSYVILVDHTNFALERYRKGHQIHNAMGFDLSILYPNQYRFGTILLKLINAKYKVNIHDDEIAFFTMHIVNGSILEINQDHKILTDTVFSVMNKVRDYYLLPLKLQTSETQRLMIHVKMLIQRILKKQQIQDDVMVLSSVFEDFKEASTCALIIKSYLEKTLNEKVNDQELVYLTIHLNRLSSGRAES